MRWTRESVMDSVEFGLIISTLCLLGQDIQNTKMFVVWVWQDSHAAVPGIKQSIIWQHTHIWRCNHAWSQDDKQWWFWSNNCLSPLRYCCPEWPACIAIFKIWSLHCCWQSQVASGSVVLFVSQSELPDILSPHYGVRFWYKPTPIQCRSWPGSFFLLLFLLHHSIHLDDADLKHIKAEFRSQAEQTLSSCT